MNVHHAVMEDAGQVIPNPHHACMAAVNHTIRVLYSIKFLRNK